MKISLSMYRHVPPGHGESQLQARRAAGDIPARSHPGGAAVSPAPAHTVQPAGTSGTVLETMDAGGYTYVRLQTGAATVWAAGPQTAVKVGQNVRLVGGMPMQNFQSKTLNRTFDTILFVTEIVTSSAATSSPAGIAASTSPYRGARQDETAHHTSRHQARSHRQGRRRVHRGRAVRQEKGTGRTTRLGPGQGGQELARRSWARTGFIFRTGPETPRPAI